MNGASAELSAKTINTPNSSIMTTMGKSQNFFRSRKKAHSSSNKDKFSLLPLSKQVFDESHGRNCSEAALSALFLPTDRGKRRAAVLLSEGNVSLHHDHHALSTTIAYRDVQAL